MGTNMGPNYACIFTGYFEYLVSQQDQGTFPELYKRYIHDSIGIIRGITTFH